MNVTEFKNFSEDVFRLHRWIDKIRPCTKLCVECPSAALTNGKTNWEEYPEYYKSFRSMVDEPNRFNKHKYVQSIDKCAETFKEKPNIESLSQIVQFIDLLNKETKETKNWSKENIVM